MEVTQINILNNILINMAWKEKKAAAEAAEAAATGGVL